MFGYSVVEQGREMYLDGEFDIVEFTDLLEKRYFKALEYIIPWWDEAYTKAYIYFLDNCDRAGGTEYLLDQTEELINSINSELITFLSTITEESKNKAQRKYYELKRQLAYTEKALAEYKKQAEESKHES